MDIFNVSGELENILEGNEANSNIKNRDTPNFYMPSAKDKTDKNDSQIFKSTSINLCLENHRESKVVI